MDLINPQDPAGFLFVRPYELQPQALGLADSSEVDLQGRCLKLSTREPELPSSLAQAQNVRARRDLDEGTHHLNCWRGRNWAPERDRGRV